MELVNFHIHTFYSGHGTGTVEEMAQAALGAGIRTMAFTEHYPIPTALDPQKDSAMTWEQLPQYLAHVEAAKAAHPDMTILAGAEFDWLGAQDDRGLTAASFDPFAYSLLSVHFIDGWGFDNSDTMEGWTELGVDEVWRRYAGLWIDAATSDWPCTTMAHPDLAKKWGFMPSFDLGKLYDEMVDALESTQRMIELNTAGYFYGCAEAYPAPSLLARFRRAGVPCCLGTDAHAPSQIDRGITQGLKALYEAGYRNVTVVTPDGDRRNIPLD